MQAFLDPPAPMGQGGKQRRNSPILLSIAGFDPSSGAGFTADLKVFAALGAYGFACPTAWTVQSTLGVRNVEAARPELVQATLECLEEDTVPDGVKIGMLASAQVVRAVAAWLARMRAARPAMPVVLDPVLVASSGRPLLEPAAAPLLRELLLPLVSVVTPNVEEAALLTGVAGGGRDGAARAAQALLGQMGTAAAGLVVTGGHLGETPDDLVCPRGGEPVWIAGRRIATTSTHGTGCAYSSALLCGLVAGQGLEAAARAAKLYVEGALRAAWPVGRGRGPLHHLYTLEP